MSPEASVPSEHEPEEVAIDHSTWASFAHYVGSRPGALMSPQTLYMRSQINGDLSKPGGQPVSEREALAIFEALQGNGTLPYTPDEEGNYTVRPVIPEESPTAARRTAYDEIDRLKEAGVDRFIGKTATRVLGEDIHYGKHLIDYYGGEIPVAAARWVRRKTLKGKAEAAEDAAAEKARQDAKDQELENWKSQRQTKLVLRSPQAVSGNEQLYDGESVEAQFDPKTMREFTYLNREIETAIREEVAAWKKRESRRLISKTELDKLTQRVQAEIIREFYEADGQPPLTDEEIDRRGQLLTWFATNKIPPQAGRRGR